MPAKNLAGVYRRRIQGLGNAVVFMQTSKGMMVCVVFPILLFVMYDAVRRNRYEKNRYMPWNVKGEIRYERKTKGCVQHQDL